MSKMRLISKDELLSTMKNSRILLPSSSENMLRNKIITDLIEVVEGFPEADTSDYERIVEERNYYMDMCSSYEQTIIRLCKTIALTDEPMKDTQVGDTIYVRGKIEAFRTGMRKKEVRVNVNGLSMWIDYEWLKNK